MLFQKTNKIGKIGEAAIINHYRKKGNTVIDYSNDEEYQKKDIDITINGQTVEVKTDTRVADTGNLCIELIANTQEGKWYRDGWFNISEAEVFIFYSPQTKMSYQVFAFDLRQAYEAHKDEFEIRYFTNHEFGNVYKECKCVLFPVAKMKEYCNTYREAVIQ